MKKIFSKLLIALVLSSFIAAPVFADSAKVTFVKGKVEVSRDGKWLPLKVGDLVAESETVSTGFQSEARLNLNGSVLAVAAMSRVTIETLSSSATKDNVSLYVNTGAVRSKVSHTAGKKIDYTTHTAVAVASVRGTDYVISAKGDVNCFEGAVAVYAARDYNPDRVTSTRREEAPADEEAADATTPVDDISASAPANSVVVAAGQSVGFTASGAPEKPLDTVKKVAEKAKNTTQTAGEKDAAEAAAAVIITEVVAVEQKPTEQKPENPKPVDPKPENPKPTTGSVEVSVEIITKGSLIIEPEIVN